MIKKIFISISIAISLLLPQIATAQNSNVPTNSVQANAQTSQCEKLRNQLNNAGGSAIDLPAYCTPGQVYNKIINFALYAIGIVAVIAVIYGGYIYMTAGANEANRKKGRQVLTWAIIGLVVVVTAAVIVNVIVRLLVENRFV